MSTREIPIDRPIEEKIRWAEESYRHVADNLHEDEEIKALLLKFKEAVRESHEEMSVVGLDDECRECEEKEGGSCCGAGLENRYSGTLLLANLMLDRILPKYRNDPKGCFFLGDQGCTLLARHVICVNYICKKLLDRIDPKDLSVLREKEGVELDLLFTLHEKIKQYLRKV